MITVHLLVEGGIFALLQHGLNPTFWTYILLIRHKKTQKYDFLFIKVVSAFGPGGGRTTFSIVMVKVQLIKKAKKSTFSLMDFKKILCMYSIVRVERRRFALHKVFARRPPSTRKTTVIILNFSHCTIIERISLFHCDVAISYSISVYI